MLGESPDDGHLQRVVVRLAILSVPLNGAPTGVGPGESADQVGVVEPGRAAVCASGIEELRIRAASRSPGRKWSYRVEIDSRLVELVVSDIAHIGHVQHEPLAQVTL